MEEHFLLGKHAITPMLVQIVLHLVPVFSSSVSLPFFPKYTKLHQNVFLEDRLTGLN